MSENFPTHVRAAPDPSIRTIRALAVLAIFVCHILEGYGSPLAWWLNAGVQIFLFISGYVYGRQTIRDWGRWFGGRLRRLLPPYYVLLSAVVLAHALALNRSLFGRDLWASLLCIQDFAVACLPGCDHLWFITLILTCYLMVPPLQWLRERVASPRPAALVFFVALPAGLFLVYKALPFLKYTYVANLSTFAWGYFFASHREALAPADRRGWLAPVVLAVAVLGLALRGALESAGLTEAGTGSFIYHMLVLPWSKAAVGMAVFLGLLGRAPRLGMSPAVAFIDRNSYELYLTHHLFIFGPFSLLGGTANRTLDVLLIAVLSAVSAVALKRAAGLIASGIGLPMQHPKKPIDTAAAIRNTMDS